MRKAKQLWVLAGLPVVLAACGGEDVAVEESPESVMTDPAVPVEEAPMDMGATATTVALEPLGESEVTGEATITPQDTQSEVMVRLTGLNEGDEHAGHIHSGTCDNVGGVVAPLQPITGGADGTGTTTATVDVDANTLTGGDHVIQYHQAGGGPGVICGEIAANQM